MNEHTTHDMNAEGGRGTAGRRVRRTMVGGLVVAAALAVGSVAAAAPTQVPAASNAVPASADGTLGPRLERACLRIPNLSIRTENVLTRIQGDAETRGSLVWLQAQIDRARDQDRDQLVTVLENRLQVRTATVPVLELRQEKLAQLAERCRELGVGV